MTAADVLRAALAGDVENLQALDARLRAEPSEADVHAARVSTRRLRCHLRTFAPLCDEAWSADLSAELRWLCDGLSSVRDADVLLAGLEALTAGLPDAVPERVAEALRPIRARRDAAHERLGRLIREPRYDALLAALTAAVREPRVTAAASAPAETMVGILMKPVWRSVRKAVRQAGRRPGDADLHRIRIKAKYLRYAAEAMAPVAGRRAKRFARRVEALQTRLGKQHDAVNAAAVLREHLAGPNAAFLDAELVERETAVAAKLRRRWRACWERVDDADARFW